MINYIKVLGILLFTFSIFSCGEEDFVSYDNEIAQQISDAYLQINSPVISFQAGTPSYEVNMDLINGTRKVTTLNVFSEFTDANTGIVADKVLLASYDVDDSNKFPIVEMFTYDQLRNNITINGQALPADDLDLAIGSGWKLNFVGETEQGDINLSGNVNIAVLSRFAGLYRVLESDYYRINVQSGIADWSGQERFIGSVDETTFSYNDYWGPFGWAGSSFTFSIDPNTNVITAPLLNESGGLANGGALFSGNRGLGCHTEPGMFVDVPCTGSNILEIDDASGKHVIKLTYGYFTDGSGSRQFYEVLEKIVD